MAGRRDSRTKDEPEVVADELIAEDARDDGAEPDEDALKRRAYELYVERGGIDGHDLEDWLQAERELRDDQRR